VCDPGIRDAAALAVAGATPADLEDVDAALASAPDGQATLVLRLVKVLLIRRITVPVVEPMVIEKHELAAEFEPVS
jgi:hypothetical protein